MCGILGVIGPAYSRKRFQQALDLQRHRGPDDEGYFEREGIQLGHRRLSIIDVSTHASQPMVAGHGDLIGVFNGEIYNYRELRSELELKGYRFKTGGDTEVLINGYHLYGKSVLDKLIGMFSFAIYDWRSRELFLARDRLGIKPLYYSASNGRFVFSSEIKSIRYLDEGERQLNNSAVASFLSFRYSIQNDSFYEGIDQVPPGHFMVIGEGLEVKAASYWSLENIFLSQEEDLGEEYYAQKIQELLKSSISYRMIADVPVGAYLSGGVDSSAVVAEMSMLAETPVKTFTIGFEESGFNEFEYARIVASQYKTDHHEILLSQDNYSETMEELIKLKDAPLGVPNEVPLYKMSQALKQHITVVLSGEGADEIFGGYGRIFRSSDDFDKIRSCHAEGAGFNKDLLRRIKEKYGDEVFSSEVDHFLYLYRYTPLDQQNEMLHPEFGLDQYNRQLVKRFRDVFDALHSASYRDKMMLVFEKLHLPGLLQRVDVTTMAASVEARVPFVDHRLVEFAFQIPEKYKLKWKKEGCKCRNLIGDDVSEVYDIPKYILKKSLETKLPDKILYRKKMGFPVPLERWFGKDFRTFAAAKLIDGELVRRDILSSKYVKDFVTGDRISQDATAARTAWMLLSLELFVRNF